MPAITSTSTSARAPRPTLSCLRVAGLIGEGGGGGAGATMGKAPVAAEAAVGG